MIDWYTVALSLLPDDPWATSPRIIAHLSVARVQTLGHNLAVAGALCSSFNLGMTNHNALYWHARNLWVPNTKGKAAP